MQMSLFTNYDNISDTYIPNNLVLSAPSPRKIFDYDPPYNEYNIKGNFTGYSWHYGESFDLTLQINKTVYVEESALIYDEPGEGPDDSRPGFIGQRAYNIVDNITWVCVAIRMNEDGSNYKREDNEYGTTFIIYEDSFVTYVWLRQDEFTFPENGTKPINISSYKGIEETTIKMDIVNFRWEPLYSDTLPGASSVSFHVTPEDSKKLLKGVYYCVFTIYGKDEQDRDVERFAEKYMLLVK